MALAVSSLAACALPLFFTSSLALEVERSLDMTDTQLGASITVFWVVATLGSFPGGRLADRMGAARSLRLAGGLVALGSGGVATLAGSFTSFAALLAVTALGNALVGPAMSALVTGDLLAQRRGTVFGLQQSGIPLASIVAGVALPTVGATLGWRWVFVLGALAVVGATGLVRDPGPSGAASGDREDDRRPELAPRVSRTSTILFTLGGFLGSAASNGLITYLVVYSVTAGLSANAAGVLLAVASVVAATARIGLGVLADRRRGPLAPQIACLMLAGAAGFGLLSVGVAWATVAGCLLVLGIGWGWSGLYVLSAVEQGAGAPGRAVGAAVTGTFAGAIVGPLLVGLVSMATSFALAWLLCGALSLAGAGAFLAARRLRAADAAPVWSAVR